MDRILCIRFDVDTPVCMTGGMPALLRLAREEELRFTFFCNMGRSISWPSVLRSRARRASSSEPPKRKLGMAAKLGWSGLLRTIALNPEVGAANTGVLQRALRDGHELGLHGGRNHSAWHHDAINWPAETLRDEIRSGLDALRRTGAANIDSFASPGWTSPPALPGVLAEFGFAYLCDASGPSPSPVRPNPSDERITDVFTSVVGNGGVGYLEECAASGESPAVLRERYRRDLERAGAFAMMYDHPCFAGRRGLPLLRDFIAVARELGFAILPLREAVPAVRHD